MTDLTRLMFDDGASRSTPKVNYIRVIHCPHRDQISSHMQGYGDDYLTGSYGDTGLELDTRGNPAGTVAFFEDSLWICNPAGLWAVVLAGSIKGYIPLHDVATGDKRLTRAEKL